MLWEHAVRFSAKLLRKHLQKYWKVFWKTTDTWSVETLKSVRQKYWEVLCKNTDRCCIKILKGVLQNCWSESQTLTQNAQHFSENSGTWSVFCYIMTFKIRMPKDNKQMFRAKSFASEFFILNKTWKSTYRRREELWSINMKK